MQNTPALGSSRNSTMPEPRKNNKPAIEVVRSAKNLGLSDFLQQPNRHSSFRLSPGKKKETLNKRSSTQSNRVGLQEVFIDPSGKAVQDELCFKRSSQVKCKQNKCLATICTREIVIHLSFRELSDLLQLCQRTRNSSIVLKC